MQHRRFHRGTATLLAFAAGATCCHLAFATSAAWTGLAGDGLWQSPTNWTPSVPGSTSSTTNADVATFTGPSTSTAVTVDLNRNLAGITLDDTTALFTIGSATGNPLLLSNAGVTQATATVNPPTNPDTGFVPPEVIAAPILLIGPTYTFIGNSPNAVPFRFTGAIAPLSAATTLTLNGSNTAGMTASITSQIDGVLADAAGGGKLSLTKDGPGGWQIESATAQNTYSGDTVVNQGVLRFTTLASVSPNSKITINAGGTLRISVAGTTVPQITVNHGGALGVSTSSSQIVNIKTDAGPALLLNNAGGDLSKISIPISLTGTTPLQGGVTFVADASTPQNEIGATSSPFNTGTVTRPFDIGTSNTVNASYDLRIRGPLGGSGGILKKGPGILRIDNANNPFTGSLEVQEGELRVNASNSFTGATLPDLLVDGGIFHITSGLTQAYQSVTLTKGSLIGSNATAILQAPAYAINVAAGDTATADITLANAASSTTLTKSGAGTAVLSGANTYTGVTTLAAGQLIVKGSAPRDNLFNNAGIDLQAGTASFDYDGVDGGGSSLGTILPLMNAAYPNFSTGPIRSSTASATRGLGYYDDGNAVNVVATFRGDVNLDGRVNADDYALIDRGYAQHLTGWTNGDLNYDGSITSADYLVLDANYGTSGVSHEAITTLLAQRESQFGSAYVAQLTAALPEPASLLTSVFCLLASCSRRRR